MASLRYELGTQSQGLGREIAPNRVAIVSVHRVIQFACVSRSIWKRSGFHYQYSNYQVEYSRNLIFEIGGHMDQGFSGVD